MKPISIIHQLRALLVSFFFCSYFSVMYAQPGQLYFKHLTTDDGLSQGVVNNIHVDRKGFVWFTTYDGINRFDGSQCISNNQIGPGMEAVSMTKGLVEDNQGDIWFGSETALIHYSYAKNKFRKLVLPVNNDGTPNKLSFYSPVSVHDHIILIDAGFGVLYLYDTSLDTWTRLFTNLDPDCGDIKKRPLPPAAKMFSRNLMSSKSYGAQHHFFRVQNKQDGNPAWVDQVVTDTSFQPKEIYCAFNDSVLLMMSADNVLWAYNFSANKMEKLIQVDVNRPVLNMYLDPLGNLWMATFQHGLLCCDIKQGYKINLYKHEDANEYSLMSNQVSSLTVTDKGMLWVGSWGMGVDYCSLSKSGFSHRFTKAESSENKTDNYIRGIQQGANGHFYCMTQFAGVVELNNDLTYIRTIDSGPGNTLGMNAKKTTLYFGEGVLCTYDVQTKRVKRIPQKEPMVSYAGSNVYYHFAGFHNEQTLAATLGGVWVINKEGDIVSELPGLNDSGVEQSVFAYEDKRGLIYKYSVSQGVEVYRFTEGRYRVAFTFPEKFTAKFVHEEIDSSVWVAGSNGVYVFDPSLMKVKRHYTMSDGLPNNMVYAIAPDQMGRLWMSTNKGISMFSKKTGRFRNYAGVSGMQGNEYNSHTVVTATDGRIIFGGVNGLTVIRPWEVKTETSFPVIQFTAMKADSSISPFQFNDKDVWRLSPGTNTVEFNFTAIDFINPSSSTLRYRLTGFDKEWVMSANPGYARYVKLPAGKYTFEVMTTNADGEWGKEVKHICLDVQPFWWQRWWIKSLTLILLLAGILLFIRQYIRQKIYKQQVALEKQLAVMKERERIVTDLHDDVGATLSSMHIYGDLASESWEQHPQESRRMIEKISSISRELLGRMGDIIWSMKPTEEESQSLELRLKNYSNELLSPKNIRCSFIIDDALLASITDPEVRKTILLITKEAMNNIAKYSNAKHAGITVLKKQDMVELSIKDDGKGFDPDHVSTGNGLGNIKKRCLLLGGTCQFSARPGEGVHITCHFPMANISYTG